MSDLGSGRVAVDTALFIYFLEEDERFLPLVEPLYRDADSGRRELITSALTLLEVMVVPYRAGNTALAERYEHLLLRSRGIRVVDISIDQLRTAAQLRAAVRVKTPDALQLAAALTCGCSCFVTNDRRIPEVPGLRVLQLTQYASA
jgi:predicted nucleic acid-binding protein